MTRIDRAVLGYAEAWNAKDTAAREAALRACWAPDGVMFTPSKELVGIDALLAEIEAFRSQHADEAVLTTVIDQHHDAFRFVAHLVRRDGTTWGETMDVGEVNADGKIVRILSFPGASPAPR